MTKYQLKKFGLLMFHIIFWLIIYIFPRVQNLYEHIKQKCPSNYFYSLAHMTVETRI